ncbi:isoprenylcysteine carboxylmethyltransferase family protein [Paraburkholderia sp. DHOC27]|uniref:methyltransferase family protein n=1 Tax=Paraburkholderia sp. DHOC27 TaxID=2303330 RepID=UPI000E3BC428|nr:isoprenylcysteine carboxylmethyltransferase family protein [Paraburkholderia sp. DHOC27]RFU44611.1 isoprenylcysteine carboxylmethyltransferase family protein [Paraburkholderia sp. DHOC27]
MSTIEPVCSSPSAEPTLSDTLGQGTAPRVSLNTLEIAIRVFTASCLGIFAFAAIREWLAAPSRITLVLLVVTACMTTGLSLFSRTPKQRDWRPLALLFSFGGTYYFVAIRLAPGMKLVPETVGAMLQVSGLLLQVYAKASLRRSFGILPANRGVVSRGAYRLVRHPMYLGYLVAEVGFLLTNFGLQNIIVYVCQFAFQIGRIVREEAILSDDERYRAYKGEVRYRVIPGVF